MVKVYLSGVESFVDLIEKVGLKYVMVSYYSLRSKDEESLYSLLTRLKNSCGEIMLDSGAYTYLMDVMRRGREVEISMLDKYYSGYINFLKKYQDFFVYCFELDLDLVAGQEWVDKWWNKAYRKGIVLQRVFHRWQSMDVLKRYLEHSDVELIGSPVLREYKKKEYLRFAKYIHNQGKKFHGFAYTPKDITLLKLPYIYSVDSTSWLLPVKFGKFEYFEDVGESIKSFTEKTNFNRIGGKLLSYYGLVIWKRFQEVLDDEVCQS